MHQVLHDKLEQRINQSTFSLKCQLETLNEELKESKDTRGRKESQITAFKVRVNLAEDSLKQQIG